MSIPDLDSIAIVTAYVQERLSMLPWLAVKRSHTLHSNQLRLECRRQQIQVVPKQNWFHAGFIIADWDDPLTVRYVGPSGSAIFSAYESDMLDKIVQFLEEKFKK
jgi:hypothetical protein